jgi:hypothetical protein
MPGVLLADVEPLAGLVDGVPVVEIEVPEPVVEVVSGAVVGVVVRLIEVVPEGDVFELADGFAPLVPGNGSHGTAPFGVLCGTGVAVLAGGVAVCGVGEDVCADGVAVREPDVEVCPLLAPTVIAVKAIVPSSTEILVFMESSKIDLMVQCLLSEVDSEIPIPWSS